VNFRAEITIARIIARLNVGGPAIQAILMTEALRAKGYRTLLLSGEVPPGEASLEYLAQARGVVPTKISTMSRRVSSMKDLASFWRLLGILRREKPLVVHTHTAKAGTLGRIAAFLARTPVRVHTFHGHVFNGYFSPKTTRAVIAIERFLARRTDRIVAVSESQKRELSETYRIAPAEKIEVIPLGFDLDPFLQVEEKKAAQDSSSVAELPAWSVGWIGRFAPIKAPGLFVECAALVHNEHPGARFMMVGGGELRSQCESQIRRQQLDQAVRIVGWRRDLAQVYSQLDLVVCTSSNEGTPMALLETMASGRAFVATDVGGVRDLMVGLGHKCGDMEVFANGILVPCDAHALARAVIHLGQKPELRRSMGRVGREYAKAKFSHHRLADDLDALYLSLARSKGCLPLFQVTAESSRSTVLSSSQKGT
jgi:glycosyltransferase involved in cell wall biosynthesis